MSRTPANPDPTTSTDPLVRSSDTLPTSDIPNPKSDIPPPSSHPTSAIAHPTLPRLSPRHTELLEAFTAARFDVLAFAAAAKISSVELANFAAHPDIQAHIDALMDLARKSLHLRATQARHTAINKLESIAQASDDPIETRRAASQLLRATSAPIVGHGSAGSCAGSSSASSSSARACHGLSGSSTQTVREPANAKKPEEIPFVPPPPFKSPELNFSADQVARVLADSLVDTPDVDPDDRRGNALATYAAFADRDATVNGEPIATDSDFNSFQSIADSAVIRLLNATARTAIEQTKLSGSRASFQTTISHADPRSPTHCTRHITFELTKHPESRAPHCWLFNSLTVTPPTYPNAKSPHTTQDRSNTS